MHGVKKIISEAESLPVEERATVVDSILRTLDRPDPDVDRKWAEVARHRLEELRSGNVRAVSGDQVFARVRERFGG
ncbi:MAG: addiction module protein [Deltaproteobacteria bacterium]|nr:addiction module protein [Deltaproteobacteria bacterium]